MQSKSSFKAILLTLIAILSITTTLRAEVNFDFGLPLFGIEEIRFEKTKPSDFNLTLLKKYISEQPGNMLAQLHAISRWFSLIKLSDTPRRDELIKMSTSLFKSTGKKDFIPEERLRDIFFNGLLLGIDKTNDPKNEKDHALEELLLDSEERLSKNGDYWLIKAIIFQALRHRPNGYFEPMKPEEDLKRALTLIPRTAHYYYVMGQAFRFLGSMDTSLFLSIASYEKASSLDPRNAKLQNSLLGIYMGLHEDYQSRNKPEPFWLEEAVYKKILELSPNNPHALNNLGYLYAEYGVNTQMAQELCQRAVDMDPANPGFRDSLGWAAFKNRDFKKAEEELKKSLSMKMNVYDTHYHLATLYYATGELDKAAEHYQEAIKIRPDSAEALNNLAYLYTEQNTNIKQAIEMAETAVQLEKNNASYIDTLGWAHYRDGDLDKALGYLLKANQIVSGQGEVLLHIGRVYLDKNDFDSAITYLKEAFKADPKLKDPDNSLYLAVRLKSYHSALADYHTLMGERADKERINNILMSIARLYQEEKLYDKAIDVTKLCSDVKSGIRPLSEPLFNSYSLSANSSKVSPAIDVNPESETAPEPLQTGTSETQATGENNETEKSADKLFNGLPPVSSHTLVITFGPQFFRWLSTSIAGMANFADKSITIFVNKPFRPRKNAVIRIETESITGTAMLGLLSNYFSQLNIARKNDEQPDRCEFGLGKSRIYAIADRNSVYLSGRPISETERIELLNQLCPFNPESFIELIYNWKNFETFIPQMLQPFVKNPFAPFIRIHTRYSYKDGNLNEFSAATTGKAENDEFMKRFARSLFAFKVQTQQMGLETVIKVRGDEDVIYVSTDFENLAGWLAKRLNRWYGLVSKLLELYTSRTICILNRMLYSPELEKSCPTGGSIRTDAGSGLIYCSQHSDLPAIPMILDEHACCSYNRNRLFRYLQNTRAINASGTLETSSVEELAKKLGVPLCPTSGTWTLDEKGIKCSEHEN